MDEEVESSRVELRSAWIRSGEGVNEYPKYNTKKQQQQNHHQQQHHQQQQQQQQQQKHQIMRMNRD